MSDSEYLDREAQRQQDVLKLQARSAHRRWGQSVNPGPFVHVPSEAIEDDPNPLWTD